jgi:hypothetical protein
MTLVTLLRRSSTAVLRGVLVLLLIGEKIFIYLYCSTSTLVMPRPGSLPTNSSYSVIRKAASVNTNKSQGHHQTVSQAQ